MPLGQPSVTPQMVASYMLGARAPQYIVSPIPKALPPQGFTLSLIYLIPIIILYNSLPTKSPYTNCF